jgi:peptide alpha-N-acetyltransferase
VCPILRLLPLPNKPNKVFDDFEDDQYDFHGYSLRKFTVNIYLKFVLFCFSCARSSPGLGRSLLTWEDQLRSHPAYIKSALSASRVGPFHLYPF